MATTIRTNGKRQTVETKNILPATLIGAAAAVVLNVVLWAIMQFVLQMNLQVSLGGPGSPLEPLPVLPVIVLTALPALLGGVVFWLLARFTTRPHTIFLIVALVILVGSFIAPFSAFPGLLVNAIGLNVLHLGAALPVIWALLTRTRAS